MIKELNDLGHKRRPCVFIIDYSGNNWNIWHPDQLPDHNIAVKIRNIRLNEPPARSDSQPATSLKKKPISIDKYSEAYQMVQAELHKGNSYLVNLCFPTLIEDNLNLVDIYNQSQAPYKLLYKDQFVVFSPECFVRIEGQSISTYPMKGTIRSDAAGAPEALLNDPKELAEHTTIVDLLRNDLAMVAKNVRVESFRYLDRISTAKGDIYQTSSRICADLSHNWHNRLGDIVSAMLPAGSVTGAPKRSTMDIISRAECWDRGYYTGIMGYFDGNDLDSAVLIRFIEKIDGRLYYKSGGGITVYSRMETEYTEMVDKVYVPLG